MKLPISLLVLAAVSQALSVPPVAKISEAKIPEDKSSPTKSTPAKSSPIKSSVTKQKDDNLTSKRELYEGNYGERNTERVSKYEDTEAPPQTVYAKELQDMISEESPSHQIFGVRLPQIAKISDVLSEHGPSFEAAVARHLHSPTSVYQTRLSSPTSFEVPAPAASQSAYSNPKAYKLRTEAENELKLQEVQPKGMELPSQVIPLYTVNQPRLRFEVYPQPLDSPGLSRQYENLPQDIFHPQQVSRKVMSSLFPIYDQLGPFRYPGQVVPSQFLHQNGLYQIVPVRPKFDYGNQEGNRDKDYSNQENHEQLKAGQTKFQIDVPVPKQGYHAHPNGAISFASFSHNLPVNTQYETSPQRQSETFHEPQPPQLQSQPIPEQQPPRIQPEVMLQSQEQKLAPVKQQFQIPEMFHRLIQDLEKYQPLYQQQPQFIPFKQQVQNQPRMLNALQQHLLFRDPRVLPNPQLIQLQRLPAFKPLPQSLLSSESFLQQTSRLPAIPQQPRPFSYEDQSTQNPENFDLPLAPAPTKLTPLPPLKPNYSKLVKPLEPQSRTTPVFLPTPLLPLPTSKPKEQPVADQLISSTTIQPNDKSQEDPKEQSIQKETLPLSQTSQPLKPEITHQSQPTVQPPSIQSTTYLPFVTQEPQSVYFQYSTPQPVYQSTKRPQSPRHDVVIQRQEIQELFFEPSPQPSSKPYYKNQHQVAAQQEHEEHQLRTQPHHQLFEQLKPLQFQQELPDINPQQYQLEVRQSKSSQKQDSSRQYLIQFPLQLQNFQPKLLENQQSELKQSQQEQQVFQTQQQQLGSEQAQQKHALKQDSSQQYLIQLPLQLQNFGTKLLESQQSELEQSQQEQQVFQTQQQQLGSEQAQQKHAQKQDSSQQYLIQLPLHLQNFGTKLSESQQSKQEQSQQEQPVFQTQQQHQHGSEKAKKQQHGSEQEQQYQRLDQIQISTLKPSQNTENQTKTVGIPQQPEPQPQLQQQSNLEPTTGQPKEQPEHSSEPTLNVEEEHPYLGPLLTSSELPQIYAHQQQFVPQPEYRPLLDVPSYSDVQYFGKFAETLFGNHHP